MLGLVGESIICQIGIKVASVKQVMAGKTLGSPAGYATCSPHSAIPNMRAEVSQATWRVSRDTQHPAPRWNA